MNGLCECGCGGRTSIASQTSRRYGHVQGQPVRFIRGHSGGRWALTTTADRIWSLVDAKGPDDCWPWIETAEEGTYGRLSVGGVVVAAHRVAYELSHGPIPAGQVVRHTCDNRPCCNPAHLVVGSQLDNMRDAVERGRLRRGSQKWNAKLDEAKVREIHRLRAAGMLQADIAARFGVHATTVRHILSGRRWRHVTAVAS